MRFSEFFNAGTIGTENVDSSQIEAAYNKANCGMKVKTNTTTHHTTKYQI